MARLLWCPSNKNKSQKAYNNRQSPVQPVNKASEDTLHALRDCEDIQGIWIPKFTWIRCDFPHLTNFNDLVTLVGQQLQNLEPFSVIAWSVWFWRNKIWCQEETLTLKKTYEAAIALLTEMRQKSLTRSTPSRRSEIKCKPPDLEMLKANYNGAVFEDSDEAGIGVVF